MSTLTLPFFIGSSSFLHVKKDSNKSLDGFDGSLPIGLLVTQMHNCVMGATPMITIFPRMCL